ncbi:DNA topoisomerase 1 beta-like isoform X1 [Zingiber officinale]|uniref:DNA topoisomerase 1 beta-like isoform X1 n=1 Tax=Zingiber officinale TaxID=94328 RepID=UPI001C4BE012|nr:DNA topoisomerase 1 beta-like isoform X1 [Zingiber officinale]XP_042474500.1 DNA topoisomerase 1 beta-like isoform X1 [Zingiber officinale]
MNDSEEDDDAPIIFRRSNSLLKQGHSTSSLKKTTAQKDSSSIFHQFVQNDSSSHKQNATSLPKASSEKPMAGSNIGSLLPAQSTNSSHDKLTTNDRRPKHEDELSDSDDDKPLSHRHNSVSAIVQRKCSVDSEKTHIHSSHLIVEGRSTEKMDLVDNPTIKSENSDDDKPLSVKYSGVINRSAFSHAAEAPQKPKPSSLKSMKLTSNTSEETDDSEDAKPLLSRFQSNVIGVSSAKVSNGPEKPLSSKLKLNGSNKKGISSKTTAPKGGEKRPLSDANPAESSSSKKAKLTGTSVSAKVKQEVSVSKESKEDDNDHTPIAQRMKKSPSSNSASINQNTLLKTASSSFKKSNLTMNKKRDSKFSKSLKAPVGSGGEQKWTTLQHNGVIFPPLYKPHGIKMLYKGQPVDLTPEQEEVATMFAVMKDTDYALKKQFIKNFMDDWRLILGKNHIIKKFEDCDFTPIYEWHLKEKEKKKQMTSEEKKAAKEEKLKQEEKYMWAIVDGVKEKVGNFRVEPPGLFRGRGEHPKMGKLKKRIRPTDITINIGKDVPIPKCPIPGERWKEVKHDNTVTWLAFWNDPINPKEFKYVFLAASSSLKGQSDKEKYEKSRLLKDYIQDIRANYTRDFNSKDPTKRQISVATYLIDKLALRAGNEKDDDEADDEADTVGCCTLKVENVELVPPNKLKFDFLGKDSIRYLNTVEVEPPVYTAIGDFRTAKKSNGSKKDKVDDLFDLLDTSKLNAHLKELMPGLTAKVFRTYNASITLDVILNKETRDGSVPEKVAVYQHANKEVAIICNHQRSVSKSHETQMSKLNEKINDLKTQREELTTDLSRAKLRKPPLEDKDGKPKKNLAPQAIENKIAQLDAKIEKMEMDKQIKEDLKTVALGTSKINYLDLRISVAWCKRHEVPIEKIFNKSLLAKFTWAMDVDPNFRF